jgi:secreted Zn-dependent insulinase-like peptidase
MGAKCCRFQDEEDSMDTVSGLAAAMFCYRPEHVLSGAYLHEEWDPALVQQIGEALSAKSDGMRVDLQTSGFENLRDQFKATFEVRLTTKFITSLQMLFRRGGSFLK